MTGVDVDSDVDSDVGSVVGVGVLVGVSVAVLVRVARAKLASPTVLARSLLQLESWWAELPGEL